MTVSKTQRIAVLAGGFSEERAVSLRSGKNVLDALTSLGYNAVLVDPISTLDFTEFDAAFNVLHGAFGEDGTIQALLEEQGVPYTGSGVAASLICMNKVSSKTMFERHNIPTAAFSVHIESISTLPPNMSYPVVLKPLSEGSSVGVSIADNDAELLEQSQALVSKYATFLLEDYVEGVEVTVGIIQSPHTQALPVLELRPENRFYDYEAKYTPGMTTFVLPAEISALHTQQVQELAIKTFDILGCHGLGRVDFIVHPEKGPFALEVNTVPGMTNTSDLPAQAKHQGMSFEALVEGILQQASLKRDV
jgi:D-alanine-D-alanine ligase